MLRNDIRMEVKNKATHLVLHYLVGKGMITTVARSWRIKMLSSSLKAYYYDLKCCLMRWMKLEPIIQSEVSQKEKHQYSILTHIYGI